MRTHQKESALAGELPRVERRSRLAIVGSNVSGAIVAFVVGVFVVPSPHVAHDVRLQLLNAGLLVVLLGIGFPLAVRYLSRRWRRVSSWIGEDRKPTAEERDQTIAFPFVLARTEAGLWVLSAIPFVTLNAFWSRTIALECAVEILLGGITTCALAYLLDERISRPVTAEALKRTPLDRAEPVTRGVGARLTLAWLAGAAVPLAAIVLLGVVVLLDVPASRDRIGIAIATIGVIGLIVGLIASVMTSRMISEPLSALRTAVRHVGEGDLEVSVEVDDASEVGMLQEGFNRMVKGLRERDRLRDLFGRQVGEDVAREALESESFELGGETREAAVMFVDIVGSTAMASEWRPQDVVAELNSFFAIVVDCVTLHGGWVNKFEGDAALCVFGAPTSHPDAAGAALATARTLRTRLENELPSTRAAIGVSAGTVVAGNVGTPERYEYTVIGDPVNEAARLTDLAKTVPGRLLTSDAALERAQPRERMRWRTGDQVELRGRTRPTVVATIP